MEKSVKSRGRSVDMFFSLFQCEENCVHEPAEDASDGGLD